MAFAAVISLKHTIERLDNPTRQITKSAYEKLDSLGHTLKGLDYEYRGSRIVDRSVIHELDEKIREAVWKLEDVLESYQLSQGIVDEKEVEQEIDSFLKMAKKLRDEYERVLNIKPPSPAEEDIIDDAAAVSPIHNNSTTVGLSDLSEEIRTQLLVGYICQIVSLVGMAGIGKTHLARDIYHHPLILQRFDIRLWLSLGPEYEDKRNLFVDILTQIEGKPRVLFREKSMDTLRNLLQNSLSGRRYLIVLNDIWSTAILRHCIDFLPNDKNGSRFLLTTRLQRVAEYSHYSVGTKFYKMPFLNNEESWNLLWQNVFADESNFPSQLEKAGRKIAELCEGLPLLILTIADILRWLDKTEEYWNKVAEKKTNTFTDAYEKIYEVLLLSYEYLSQHLKPCFLYMGVFPQGREIPLSQLTNFWMVEDFLEPIISQNLEDFSMKCMEDLVSNSLAIVCKRRVGIKSSKLHCVYWYLCVTEARKNKFFHVLNKLEDAVSIERPRRLSIQNNILFGIKEAYDSIAAATSTTRSLLFTGENHQYPVPICFDMMLLMKVLDALAIRFYEFPNDVVKLLQLRYISLTHYGEVPSSISKLQHLEWLILRRHHNIKLLQRDTTTNYLPEQIWDMQELRYLRIRGSNLPNPSKGAKLPKLLTLYVDVDSCTEVVFKSIPNLKKLGIKIELHPECGAETVRCLEHIGVLDGLESLKCVVVNPFKLVVAPPDHLSNLPQSLKKLSLKGLGYPWKFMSEIRLLPSLQVLKLRCSAFQGSHWEITTSDFPKLEYLLLEDIDLVHWTAEEHWFGLLKSLWNLRHLIVRHCYKLKKIPLEIGGITTLEMIEVEECSPSVVASAHQIKEEKTLLYLQLDINYSWNL